MRGGDSCRKHKGGTFQSSPLTAFLATTDSKESRAFYCDTLGLRLEDDNPFSLVVQTPNATLRIQKVKEFTPHPFTALGWTVPDIRSAAQQLQSKGIHFERFPGMTQDDLAIWLSPSGAKVCWFKDPDGNILSLTQLR
jgi:catechol 2,3-dioxygenase-like lactoylglutathione lyase family enzyme